MRTQVKEGKKSSRQGKNRAEDLERTQRLVTLTVGDR